MKQNIPITIDGQSQGLGSIFSALSGGETARSLYIHVPFCFHKCHYCDFYSFVDSRDQQGGYLDALEIELASIAPWADQDSGLSTIFIGGGTPTLLNTPLWERLLNALAARFSINPAGGRWGGEFTVECNPETATRELFDVLMNGGVNRISIGAQSFNSAMLEVLERWHEPPSVRRALELARDSGIGRASIDLIYGIPGQTLGMWAQDLNVLCTFAEEGLIDHASCYALTYEPNTAMTMRLKQGEFEAADEETEARMYEMTVERLMSVGLGRYEVSNFARPGSECRHNLAYWRQESWLAAGPSASGQMAGNLWKNVPRLGDWMKSVQESKGWSAIVDHEGPDARRALAERIMLGVRISEGIPMDELLTKADSLGVREPLEQEVQRQIVLGLVEKDPEALRLSDTGFLHADGVASALMGRLDPDG